MNKIEKQSGYDFWYQPKTIDEQFKITLTLKNTPLNEVLKQVFVPIKVSYELIEQTILLKPIERKTGTPDRKGIPNVDQIKGKVVGEDGKPIPGATVKIKNTNITAITDEFGKFTIKNTGNGVLLISSIGYESLEVGYQRNSSPITIMLKERDNKLNDVEINAGYYTVKDRERTGNISRIQSETIAKQPVSNPLATLQGRIAGLVVTQRSGLPGSDFSVQLRGKGSIQSGTVPLFLIDGVPYPTQGLAQTNSLFSNNPLNSINPANIESIEVLKDADATAIYGSRGANGVILITTKKGNAGATSADLILSTGFGKITRSVEMMNTAQYIEMRKEAFANDGVTPTLANASDLLAWDNNRYTDLKDVLLGGTARTQNTQFTLNGGNQSTSYAFGANYYKESTVFPGENALQRKDANLSLNHRSADQKFHINLQTSYGINTSDLYIADLTILQTQPPNLPPFYDADGKLNWSENGVSFSNPFGRTLEGNDIRTNRFTGNAVMGYKLLPGLELKLTGGFNSISLNERSKVPIAAQNPANAPTGNATFGDSNNETWILEPQLNYSADLKHYGKLSMLIGGTWQETTGKSMLVRGSGYTNDLLLGSIEGAVTKTPVNAFNEYKYQAIFARLNYNLLDTYIINLTSRRDGSSRFGPGNQFANFGAIGIAWILTEEDFIRNNFSFLSFAKIRGSFGLTGNDQINNYQYLDSYISTPVYGNQAGLIPARLQNKNYGWEANEKLEMALEMGFLQDKIRLSMGWYRNISDNQLISYTLPGQAGFPAILRNLDARIRNQGLEVEMNTVNIKKADFNWSTSANITVSRNKLLAFPTLENSSYATTYVLGESLGILQGYHYLGIDQNTGAYQFEDKNGDGLLNRQDYSLIGTKDPIFYGGIGNAFQCKGFSLDVFFQFVKQRGNHLVYGSSNFVGARVNTYSLLTDRWTPNNPNAKYQAYTQAVTGPVNLARTLIGLSDAALVDASFIRLKNLAFAYSFDTKIIKNLGLKRAKLFIQGQNLVTLTNYPEIDPEGQSVNNLPPLRVLTLGLQVTL
ncbi:SusC/RagA family TonB-linked outer membrane protein [Pedobacter suwonensis]|uniref:SusC/RagA family TonB-linked outer membrane protein n=1 Tax=Pedobacter suwonensis TaxID=332999 RepID=UPI00367A4F30